MKFVVADLRGDAILIQIRRNDLLNRGVAEQVHESLPGYFCMVSREHDCLIISHWLLQGPLRLPTGSASLIMTA